MLLRSSGLLAADRSRGRRRRLRRVLDAGSRGAEFMAADNEDNGKALKSLGLAK
jgi:hypothetical protein